ncbi:hypothetical protein KTR10_01835 [Candidatus Kaiserbacteria bacterium]|nr:hypothetical protein [Candidatus Kaiserbacteria bacterium]
MKAFYFTLVTTFLVGFIAGSYIYFVTEDALPDFFAGTDVPDFEIIGDAYGGCQMLGACPSFVLRDDGTYIHQIPQRGGTPINTESRLSSVDRSEVRELLRATNLARIEQSTFSGTCPIAFDGLAYRYRIYIGETRYDLDSCRQDLEGELFEYLPHYFERP